MTGPRQYLAALSALAVMAAAPAALAQKSGGILKVYHRDSPPSMSIHEEATNSTVQPIMSVMNNLVLFDQSEPINRLDTIRPDLAKSWSWNEDGTKLTFELREGVKWHDGKPFTAADVKCTWDLLQEKGEARLRKNPRKGWYHNLEGVTVDGDYRATFNLRRPQPSFLGLLASGYSPVYACHVTPAEMRTHPIGTGPFKFVEFRQNEHIKTTRNPDYWEEGKPYLDGIEYTIIRNRSTRVLAFIAGEFDMTLYGDITIPILRDVRSQAPHAVCQLHPTNVSRNLIVNRERPPFDDARIRRAMMLALDRQAFVDILSEGNDDIGGAMLPPPEGVWGMPKEMLEQVVGYGPDIEANRTEARKLMEEAGYGPNKRLPVKVSTRNIEIYRDPAVILIDQLKDIYIDGELEIVETSLWHAKVARKDYSVGMNLTGIGVDDPDVTFYENFACDSERNYTQYCNPELEKKFDEQSAEHDIEKRKKLVWEIDRQLQEDGARPMMFHARSATCAQPHVRDMVAGANSAYNSFRYEHVWLDK
ncbi:MAG: ABC transporter substrate-binding protein [Alphaproteobacteria bacterium]